MSYTLKKRHQQKNQMILEWYSLLWLLLFPPQKHYIKPTKSWIFPLTPSYLQRRGPRAWIGIPGRNCRKVFKIRSPFLPWGPWKMLERLQGLPILQDVGLSWGDAPNLTGVGVSLAGLTELFYTWQNLQALSELMSPRLRLQPQLSSTSTVFLPAGYRRVI